jgi:predicted glycogen debranching enzyme
MERPDLSALDFNGLLDHEWLVANGIGGYASSTIPSLNTRKYHGLLVASMAPPVRRMVLLSRVEETVTQGGNTWALDTIEYPGIIHPRGFEFLRAFRRDPFPCWAFQADGWTIEKTLRLIRGENTVCLSYSLLAASQPVELDFRPLLALRPIHELMYQWNGSLKVEKRGKRQYRVPPTLRTPEVFFAHDGATGGQGTWYLNTIYRRETERGYSGLEDTWSPAAIKWTLYPGQTAHFICSADPIDFDQTLARVEKQAEKIVLEDAIVDEIPVATALMRSAEQFVLELPQETTGERGGCMTQYPWSSPSMRDALAGFTGLFLVTGKFGQGLQLLKNAAATLRDGLVATYFAEDGSAPIYQGADVSLWFINAIHEYLRYTGDNASAARYLLEPAMKIIDAYTCGTRLGIGVAGDGLLMTHEADQATTWMDARAVDWVVTSRQGKPVEINALWFNALCIVENLCRRHGRTEPAMRLAHQAARAKESFNTHFWNAAQDCCYDVLESAGYDPAIRPNQLLAVSLPYPILAADRHAPLLKKVEATLLTPFGLRTLTPDAAGYQGQYRGNVIARDRAQHNGTVYPWLLGAFVSAQTRLLEYSDAARQHASQLLRPCIDYLLGDGLGQLPELFDGDAPHRPGGALASALSVAEILRAYVEDVQNIRPTPVPAVVPAVARNSSAIAVSPGMAIVHVGR